MFSLEGITRIIHEWLNNHFNPALALLSEFILVGLAAITLFALLGLGLVWMERKVAAVMQPSGSKPGRSKRHFSNHRRHIKTAFERRIGSRWR
jgi:hypothetical protein